MKVKIKKISHGRKIKLESGGQIKEILIHTDLMSPDREKISICFRGQKNSGIIELTDEEVEHLYKTIHSKIKLVKSFKVIKG